VARTGNRPRPTAAHDGPRVCGDDRGDALERVRGKLRLPAREADRTTALGIERDGRDRVQARPSKLGVGIRERLEQGVAARKTGGRRDRRALQVDRARAVGPLQQGAHLDEPDRIHVRSGAGSREPAVAGGGRRPQLVQKRR
jgi:hypothetical protein